MIEVRIDVDVMRRIQHNVTHSIVMIDALKKAGIPIDGVLITHGITHGHMTWEVQQGIDGDEWVICWYESVSQWHDFRTNAARNSLKKQASGKGEAFTWTRWGDSNAPAESEEL